MSPSCRRNQYARGVRAQFFFCLKTSLGPLCLTAIAGYFFRWKRILMQKSCSRPTSMFRSTTPRCTGDMPLQDFMSNLNTRTDKDFFLFFSIYKRIIAHREWNIIETRNYLKNILQKSHHHSSSNTKIPTVWKIHFHMDVQEIESNHLCQLINIFRILTY